MFLDGFRQELEGVTLSEFLHSASFTAERSRLKQFLTNLPEFTSTTTNFLCLSNLAKLLHLPNEMSRLEGSFNDNRAPELVAGSLAYIFEIPEFLHKPAIMSKLLPELEIDDDGLLVSIPREGNLSKDGLIVGNRFIPYHPWLASKPCIRSLSFGFIETLLRMRQKRSDINYFGLRLDEDVVMRADIYEEMETRAYIWGPTGFSEEKLVDSRFPETPSGTLTVHSRLEEKPFVRRDVSHIEVLWSRRDNLKTVQIEELVTPESPLFVDSDLISCAYLHSIWNDSERRFIHLDGAVRKYNRENYNARYQSNMHKTDVKSDKYEKVFRIDAPLTANEWADLVAKYYYQDELIVEYLSQLLETDTLVSP
ncbi:MAG: hypothetical protein SFV17_00225 [Candidatus Obscuribacter sp.]|nr:hypothetical protein [Candidatus Obscuribacter sp.]